MKAGDWIIYLEKNYRTSNFSFGKVYQIREDFPTDKNSKWVRVVSDDKNKLNGFCFNRNWCPIKKVTSILFGVKNENR